MCNYDAKATTNDICKACFYYERHYSKFFGRYVLMDCGHCTNKENRGRVLFGKYGACMFWNEADEIFDEQKHYDDETERLKIQNAEVRKKLSLD